MLQTGGIGDLRRIVRLVGRAGTARDDGDKRNRADASYHPVARSIIAYELPGNPVPGAFYILAR